MIRQAPITALLSALACLLAACASTPKPGAEPAAPGGQASRSAVSAAIALLYEGDAAAAKTILQKVIKVQPDNKAAASLLQQIDTAPEVLLGQESYAYRTRPDDTLSLLAQRYLGDPTLFYALARYNNLAKPSALTPGQMLRIPGKPRPEPQRATAPEPRATAKPSEPRPAAAPRPAAGPNPQRAAQLRVAGLEQLNRGAINQAVALLGQALQHDPGNALIRRDLDRAVRIRNTVQAK